MRLLHDSTALCTLWSRHHVMIIHGILCFIVCKRIGGQLCVMIFIYMWMPRFIGNSLRVCYDQCSTRDIAHPCVLLALVVSWYRIDVPTYYVHARITSQVTLNHSLFNFFMFRFSFHPNCNSLSLSLNLKLVLLLSNFHKNKISFLEILNNSTKFWLV